MNPMSYEPRTAREPQFPGIVMAAGIIWIIFGGPILVATLAIVVLIPILGHGMDPGTALLGMLSIGGCLGGFGAAFVVAGVKTVRGTAGDTLGNGIGSILFGLLAGGGWSLDLRHGGVGLALLVAGILALVGRTNYQAWRLNAGRPRRTYGLPGRTVRRT